MASARATDRLHPALLVAAAPATTSVCVDRVHLLRGPVDMDADRRQRRAAYPDADQGEAKPGDAAADCPADRLDQPRLELRPPERATTCSTVAGPRPGVAPRAL